ncbi:ubiquinone biosynthesis monooxygenase COQ6, mitochondrial-like [Rhopilema esculentum]|uniref:ubiquinone biosynthesis monooxygenase COQ6, mitochondrial-like n=1 Tax=Rhopilema esculentum TaxID=499914 RepID=UPI0031D809B3
MMSTSVLRKIRYKGIVCNDGNVLILFGIRRKSTFPTTRGRSHNSSFCLGPRLGSRYTSTGSQNNGENTDFDAAKKYDIVIAGGGLVGTALACLLGKDPVFQDHKILVLEAAPSMELLKHAPERYSNRVSAITPGTKGLLEYIGAWDEIKSLRYKSFSKMHVWDACGAGYITFNAEGIRQENEENTDHSMAYIIENSIILSAMTQQILNVHQNVDLHYSSRIKDIEFPADKCEKNVPQLVRLSLENGSEFQTKLLVGADGINSFVRAKAKMRFLAHDYQQTAVVATLHLEEETPNDVAWQRFLPTGPIAMLPLSRNRSSLVWSTTPADARALIDVPDDEFVDAVNNAFWADCDRHPLIDRSASVLQSIISAIQPGTFAGSKLMQPPTISGIDRSSRAMYPLGLGHASHYVNSRVALIGDAAHRVHPLAGQGVNLGASDVQCLRDVLVDAVQHGNDIGDLDHLLEYETMRQREVVPMMTAIDTLKRLFSTSFFPFVFARTIGLQATNALTPLKDQIIKHAMK